ncbi:MAG TPA: shikimate dehydrogenase [Anaerolineales bacterium]|nr:shikimate dehydrogenase [Anaerolineales bacterium]
MIKLGLIGYPLEHSLSPIIHGAALKSCSLDGNYTLFPIHPDDKQGLKDLLVRVRNGDITGFNVTIPHKQNVIELLDELTSTAKAIGAVNTIYLRNNKLVGDNTDAMGFFADLERFLHNHKSSTFAPHAHLPWRAVPGSAGVVNRQSAIVLGSGGSARAVVYALLKDGWNVTLAARRFEQAKQLAESFTNYQLPITDYKLSTIDLSKISLIVNTTPVGMAPNIDRSPWPENIPFPPHASVYDLVYNPRETKLVRDACLQGLSATTGLGMLIEQAALAFEIWTGKNPARNILFESAGATPATDQDPG